MGQILNGEKTLIQKKETLKAMPRFLFKKRNNGVPNPRKFPKGIIPGGQKRNKATNQEGNPRKVTGKEGP